MRFPTSHTRWQNRSFHRLWHPPLAPLKKESNLMKLHSRFCLAALAVLAALHLAATPAHAQAFSFTGVSTTSDANATIGETFTVGATAISVTDLGVWDKFPDGLADAHPVTIWNAGGTSVASATVPSGTTGALIGEYRYTSLPSPVTLSANTTYIITAYYPTSNDGLPAFTSTSNITSATGVSYGAARGRLDNAFPTADFFNRPEYVNANFVFTGSASATPEPGVTALLTGLSVVGTGIFARRRFRRK